MYRSTVVNPDGTCIIIDPEFGPVFGPDREAAEREIARRKALERDAA